MFPFFMVRIALVAAAVLAFAAQDSLLKNPDAPEFRVQAPAVSVVRFETSRGRIDIEVRRAWAPRGADRFVALVRHGYYDGNRFFRFTPPRWVQFGINGDPEIATAWRTRTLPDDPFVQSNVRGTVAFAFGVANGRTTQVFINTADNSATHDKEPFTPFGRVIAGMDVGRRVERGARRRARRHSRRQAGPVLQRWECVAGHAVSATGLHQAGGVAGALGATCAGCGRCRWPSAGVGRNGVGSEGMPCNTMEVRSGRGVAQPGSAPALGAGGRWFESSRPDHFPSSGVTPGYGQKAHSITFVDSKVLETPVSWLSAHPAPFLPELLDQSHAIEDGGIPDHDALPGTVIYIAGPREVVVVDDAFCVR